MFNYDMAQQKFQKIKNDPFFADYIKEIKDFYEEQKELPYPYMTYADFNIYAETGSRMEAEVIYNLRRKRLYATVILYLLEEKPEYITDICNMIWAICGEPTWAVPAHAGYTNDTLRHAIDLCTAETAEALAEIYGLLGDKLPPRIRDVLKAEIEDRIFNVYENNEFLWESWKNNWQSVCAGSIGIAYMYIAPQRLEKALPKILRSMENYLSGLGDDGCCSEGLNYWCYGFGYFIFFADMLYDFSDGKYDLLHSKKVANVARFFQKMILRKNFIVSFSDCPRVLGSGYCVGLFSRLQMRYEGMQLSTLNLKFAGDVYRKMSYTIRDFLWTDSAAYTVADETVDSTEYMESSAWYLRKKKRYSFAAKGGHNNEMHNHNDIGSFILANDKGQLLADIGVMEYTAATFSAELRFTLLQNSSLGHSVPIVDGREQLFGDQYAGTVLYHTDDEFALEIQGAYGADVPKITRAFTMLECGIRLVDTFEEGEKHTITERFISVIEPQWRDGCLYIGDAVLTAATKPTIEQRVLKTLSQTDETVYLIDYPVDGDCFELSVVVEA